MHSLKEIKNMYLEKLKTNLNSLKKNPTSSDLLGISSMHKNIMTVKKDVRDLAENVNDQFVDAINNDKIADEFTDDERMVCYDEFRKESIKIVSHFNRNFLKNN
ncbi:hypothetical protein [Mesonia maritima]|uniref:Uncharacterized protein n=1 Tax=Mesonia maritima TaxID=1793873 RepID=A0ABU1K4X9_9FLAO|nr:hypothetical protein [Mesonia maritima]MDR6300667.1 hypothetical protein [Mesonia maritima]